jgi:modulator of FtsH protease HflK
MTFTPLSQPPAPPPPPETPEEPQSAGSQWGKAHHVLIVFVAAALVIWLCSGLYQVNASEEALVERLGQFITEPGSKEAHVVSQGLHYALPWPIDRVHKVPVRQTRTLTVQTFNASPEAYEEFKRELRSKGWRDELLSAIFDPYLITGDKNVVHIEIAVQYRIRDSEAWLMTVSHDLGRPEGPGPREELFQQLVAHAMITTISKLPVERILLEGREKLPNLLTAAVTDAMKIQVPDLKDAKKTTDFDLGVEIQKVDVVVARPPPLVKTAFEAVLQAQAEKEITRNRAETERTTMKNQAESDRDSMLREANAYRNQVTEAAKGEASRFSQVYSEFQKAPDITRYRLFTDTLREVSGKAERIFWVQPGQQVIITIDPPKFDAGQVQPK